MSQVPETPEASAAAALALLWESVPPEYPNVKLAHAWIGPLVFALLMPLGSILIRLFKFRGAVWFHAGWMLFSYILSFAVLGTGVWMAYYIDEMDAPHSIIGIFVICACTLQPVTGLVHHLLYKTGGKYKRATYPHIWWGRAIITLGAINGGFGLYMVRNPKEIVIGYGVGAGILWIVWIGVVLTSFLRSRGGERVNNGEKTAGSQGATGGLKQVYSPELTHSELD